MEIISIEKEKNITSYASSIVGLELLANLAEGNEGFNYQDCLKSLNILSLHCSESDGSLRVFPQASMHILNTYYNSIPEILSERTMNLMGVIQDICKDENKIDIHNERKTFDDIKNYISQEEEQFCNLMIELTNGIRESYLSKNKKITTKSLRKKILDFIKEGDFESMLSFAVIFALSTKYNLSEGESMESIRKKAYDLNMRFPLSIGFYKDITYQILDKNIDMNSKTSKDNRWNWIWDYNVSFAIGDIQLGGKNTYLITSDKDLTDILRKHNFGDRVMNFDNYVKELKR